jgi:hypothetical protein
VSKKEKLMTSESLVPKTEMDPEVQSFKESTATPEALQKPASGLVRVTLRKEVILNGQKFIPGEAELPEDAYDCWKNAL